MRSIQKAEFMINIRMKVYGALVNRVPEIRRKYHSVRDGQTTSRQHLYAWFLLIGLNLAWLFGWRKFGEEGEYTANPDAGRKLPREGSESSRSVRISPEELAARLAEAEVISFDVFDTLLFRPFSAPSDLFYLVGEQLAYPDFRRIRMEMEEKAREACEKTSGHREVTLHQICSLMETETGIPAQESMRLEEETELSCCFANPYMLKVTEELARRGKTMIAVSDMYLPSALIQKMLKKSGYTAFQACYVSCEHGVSKSDGRLYGLVQQKTGRSPADWIHVGDNPVSDGKNARQAGWRTESYRNVNEAGNPFRAADMSAIAGSIYRGLVNTHIHNGLNQFEEDYEFGFIYGGILVLGYCQFIHTFAKEKDIDRLLFLARDGDVLLKAYTLLYPEEKERCAYALWSRMAATKLAAGYYKYDYFRRFLFHKVNQGYSMHRIFETMELTDLLPSLTKETGIAAQALLIDRNVKTVQAYLNQNWEAVLGHYEQESELGRQYYQKILDGCTNAAAIDIGWAGSGAITLHHMINRVWKLNCPITGIVAGTNTCHNAEPDMSEAQLYDGMLVSYLFSQEHNRDLWKKHDASRGDNVMMEKLLASPKASFRGFGKEQPEEGPNAEQARRIQQGILDYCRLYRDCTKNFPPHAISGRDAAAPSYLWLANFRDRMAKEDCQCVLD